MFDFEYEPEIRSWWTRAEKLAMCRSASAITSIDLALAALDEEDLFPSCFRQYVGFELSSQRILAKSESATTAEDTGLAAASDTFLTLGPVSIELDNAIQRYQSLHASHEDSDYASEGLLYIYALLTCDETLLARVLTSPGVDRYAGELLLRELVFICDMEGLELDPMIFMFPWDRPFEDFYRPPEVWDDPAAEMMSREDRWNSHLAWRLQYLKTQIERHYVATAASNPTAGWVVHFCDGTLEDVAVLCSSGQWWSLRYLEPRLESTFARADKTFYVRKGT